MKPKQAMLIIFIFILLSVHCDTTEPPSNGSLSLSVEDVSCTEAWLTLRSTNLSAGGGQAAVTLIQNNNPRITINLVASDTLLYVDSLLPNQSYKFTATTTTNNQQLTTNEVLAYTMDTTTHNFAWQTFTFGEHSSSVLYDVAIINESNIWAVGEIYMNDSLGQPDPHAYNAAHWDGQSWELKRIMFYTICGQPSLSSYTAKAIFVFSENDIWIAGGGRQLARISGTSQVDKICLPFSMVINKLWGSSSNDLYAVGEGGNIAHYSNGGWTKIESNTTMKLFDISSSDGNNIYISGGNFNLLEGLLLHGNSSGFKILKEGKNISVAEVFKPYFAGISKTVWMSNKHTVFFGGNFLYRYKLGRIDFVKSLPGNYFNQNSNGEHWGFISMIRGNSDNDFIMIGEGNTVRHFNGFTWVQLGKPYNYNSDYTWLAVDVKANIIASVGRSNASAILILLKR
jgi:hypothetical protein